MTDEEWFEFDSDLALPRGPHAKPVFYADEDIPDALVVRMRDHGLRVHTARELRRHNRDDKDQAALCAKRGWILVTRDRGFWDERRYPIGRLQPGMIILVADKEADLSDAMALAWVLFAKHYPGDAWRGVRMRATPHRLRLRMRDVTGRTVGYEFRQSGDGRLLVRELPTKGVSRGG